MQQVREREIIQEKRKGEERLMQQLTIFERERESDRANNINNDCEIERESKIERERGRVRVTEPIKQQ
jgi:hypothetical protein